MIKVVIPFADPVIVGRFVYHCHAADHEDKGMMALSRLWTEEVEEGLEDMNRKCNVGASDD